MIEAKEKTIKNLAIIEKFVEPITKLAESMLLTGSNAWGAYYAVTSKSDIDLLIIVNKIGKLGRIIRSYIKANLIDFKEQERFDVFKKLYRQNKANQFSIIQNYSGTLVSIDFLFSNTVKDIVSLGEMNNINYKGINIRIVNEFRTNIPKITGYSLDDLIGKKKIIYHPKFKEIKNNQNKIIGYISETLVDGQVSKRNQTNYFLGVMSFFLAIDPVILLDKKTQLENSIKILQLNIAKMMNGKKLAYITRQERMSGKSLARIIKSLTINK